MNTVFNIQKFCINDGPGIRTTVFLKGCPLDCTWCHNPESKSQKPEIMYNARLCIECGLCEKACDKGCHSFSEGVHIFNREACISCGACSDACRSKALECAGYKADADEIIKDVMRDKEFYDTSGGGITLSGGEPMLQFSFAKEILTKAKEKGLHTCIETCGYAPREHFEKIAPYVDIFLYDYKLTDENEHIKYTGVSNKKIIENLYYLDSLGKSIILRCPIIPNINDNAVHFRGIADIANALRGVTEINIEPYHPLGKSKAEQLGKTYTVDISEFPSEEKIAECIKEISSHTEKTVKKA